MDGGLLYWGNQRYFKQGSEIDVYFHRCPASGEHGWTFLSWGLHIRGIFIRSFRVKQNARQTSISVHRGPAGETGGVPVLDPEVIKILSLGAVWNF